MIGRQGGCASSQLDDGFEIPSAEAVPASDLITNSRSLPGRLRLDLALFREVFQMVPLLPPESRLALDCSNLMIDSDLTCFKIVSELALQL